MNTAINSQHGSNLPIGQAGNGIAFLFGAAFNLLANVNLLFLLDYALQAVVGGIICLAFKIIGDVCSPLWEKHKQKVKNFTRLDKSNKLRKPSLKIRSIRRKRHHVED